MPFAVGKTVSKNATTDKAVMSDSETERSGASGEGERVSKKRAAKAGGAQDVLKLIDVARAAGVKEIAKLRALAKEYSERADAIERKLGSMLDLDVPSKAGGTELDAEPTPEVNLAKRERSEGAESLMASTTAKKSARLARSAEDLTSDLGRTVDLLKGSPQGMRAEEIGEVLGLRAKDLAGVLKEGVGSNRLHSRGEKRATLYFAK